MRKKSVKRTMKFEISPRVLCSCQVMNTKIVFQIVCRNFMVESKVISHGKNANICFFGEKKNPCSVSKLICSSCQIFQKQQQHLHSWRYSDAEDEQNVSIWQKKIFKLCIFTLYFCIHFISVFF